MYLYPVYGGALVYWNSDSNQYVFYEVPKNYGFGIGDFMPENWGIGWSCKEN